MLVLGMLAVAKGADCAAPEVVEGAPGAAALAIRLDGALTVVPADGDAVRVEGCGGVPRLALRDGVWSVTARRPLESVTVYVPNGVAAVSVHDHVGATAVSVPARVAVVASEGALDVRDAASLRVAWHTGDVAVERVSGDVWVDHVTGSVRAVDVGGEAQVSEVSGAVAVEPDRTVSAR